MSPPDRWSEVSDWFHRALDLTPTERDALWETLDDPALQSEVQSLLAASDEAPAFLEQPLLPGVLSDSTSETDFFKEGDRSGDFIILKTLGRGSFATVYLAHQLSLDRKVALKVSPDVGEEGRTMANLEHDHIVKIFHETVEPTLKLRMVCMQYISGTTLEKLIIELGKIDPYRLRGASLLEALDELAQGDATLYPMAFQDRRTLASFDFTDALLWIGARLGEGLAYAHERGILHLDVKPGNMLINAYGRPFLTDFNISLRKVDGTCERGRLLGGTFNYMAPEHLSAFQGEQGEAIDPRADVFSLGVVLKELKNLRPDFLEDSRFAKILEVATDPKRERRFESMAALVHALEGCLELRQIERHLPASSSLARRRPMLVLTASILLPQIVGSLVNIPYNSMRIVDDLTATQQDLFRDLVVIYNLTVYPFCILWLYRMLSRLVKGLELEKNQSLGKHALAELRQKFLEFPSKVARVVTLGWMPGSVLFAWVLHWRTGPVSNEVFGHFFLSFSLSWLIALSYSYVATQFVILNSLYPLLWGGTTDIRQTAESELEASRYTSAIYPYLAGFIPLLGAILITWVGPEAQPGTNYLTFRFLVSGLIVIGMAGIAFGIKAANLLSQSFFALTGKGGLTQREKTFERFSVLPQRFR